MKVAKWGNSLAVRLPKEVAENLGVSEGDQVEFRRDGDGRIIVKKQLSFEEWVKSLRKYRGLIPADYKFDRDEANSREY